MTNEELFKAHRRSQLHPKEQVLDVLTEAGQPLPAREIAGLLCGKSNRYLLLLDEEVLAKTREVELLLAVLVFERLVWTAKEAGEALYTLAPKE